MVPTQASAHGIQPRPERQQQHGHGAVGRSGVVPPRLQDQRPQDRIARVLITPRRMELVQKPARITHCLKASVPTADDLKSGLKGHSGRGP